jgi:acyl carrier protein
LNSAGLQKKNMSANKIRSAVYDLIAQQFGIGKEEINDDLGPGEIQNWDSIGHVRLVQELEQFFSITLSVYDVMGFNSVKDIWTLIEKSTTGNKTAE